MDDFLIRAALGGIGLAVLAGGLGVFVVWRRMAYFGDTLAHSALLGVALGVLMEVNLTLAVIIVTILLALLLLVFERDQRLASDTLLGILAHASLSLGLVALAFTQGVRVDLMAYLFGDVLALDKTDLFVVWGGVLVVLGGLAVIWRPLLALSVDIDLARVEGVSVNRVRLAFMVLLALVIGLGMKLVGVLLITALLIIPAATARRWSASPESMAVWAAICGALAVILGLTASWFWDTPAGPSVVVAATALFTLSRLVPASSF